MVEQNIKTFMSSYTDYFEPEMIPSLRCTLRRVDDESLHFLMEAHYRRPASILFISIFFGFSGLDRWLLEETMLGTVKLFTAGGAAVWYLADIITALHRARKYNYSLFLETAASVSPLIPSMNKS